MDRLGRADCAHRKPVVEVEVEKWPQGRSSYVAVLLDGDRLMVSVRGYTYCLDATSGKPIWWNPLKGFGTGVPSLASIHGNSGSSAAAAIIAQRQAAAATTSATTSAT